MRKTTNHDKNASPRTDEGRYARIWAAVAAIPEGCVASYGQIAEFAGVPRGARIVGRALGRSPRELALPWHRVINAQGQIALPKDSRGYKRQIELLRAESITVVDGRVDMEQFRWQPDLDEMVWGPPALPLPGRKARTRR